MTSFRAIGKSSLAATRRSRTDVRRPDRRYRSTDGFELDVPERVVEQAAALSRFHAPNEFAALLAVQTFDDDAGKFARLEGVIPFEGAVATPSRVTTTATSERDAQLLLGRTYVGCNGRGWLHSHPQYGLFLSSTDLATQRTWGPNGIAIVVDHTSPERIAVYRGTAAEPMVRVDAEASETVDALRDTLPDIPPPLLSAERPAIETVPSSNTKRTGAKRTGTLVSHAPIAALFILVGALAVAVLPGLRSATQSLRVVERRLDALASAAPAPLSAASSPVAPTPCPAVSK